VRFTTGLLLIVLLLPFASNAQMSMVYDNDLVAYNRGLELYEKQKFGAAKEQFEKSIQLIDDQNSEVSANAHFYVADCALEMFHKDAEFLLKEFIANYSSSPRVADAWFLLGNYNYRKKKWDKAIEYYDELLIPELKEPLKSEYLFKKGYSFFQEGQMDNAAGLFFQMDDQSSVYFAPGTYYLGHINYSQGKYASALKSFQSLSSHELFGNVVPYYIVQIYHFQENYDEVISYGQTFLNDSKVKRRAEISRVVGDAFYKKENYLDAVPYLKDFMDSRNAKEKEDYYTYGYALYRTSKYDRAAEQFSKISYSEDKIGQSALYQMGESYLKAGKKSYARNSYRSASRLDFDSKIKEDALFKYAKLSYELSYDPYDGAIAAFKEYMEMYPNADRSKEAYDFLVNIYLTSKNYDAALSSIDEYDNPDVRLREAYQRIAYNKGVELFQERSYQAAISYFDRSLKYPEKKEVASQAYYWRAESYYYIGSYSKSVKAYEEFIYSPAAALTPYFNLANYNVGYAFFQQDKFLEAPSWFRRYASVKTEKDEVKLSDANLRIGDCYFMLNQYDAAQIYYSDAVKLGKSDPDYALYQKSITAGLLKRPEDKLIGLNALVKDYPKSRYLDASHYEIGKSLIATGQEDKALLSLNKVVSDFPGSSYVRKALVSIGQTLYNMAKDEEALMTFKRIIKDYPTFDDSREALIGMKNIYIDRGDAQGYDDYVNTLGFVDFSEAARDSLYYEGAETQYFDGNCKESVDAFTKYLNRFEKAIFSLNARYYRAECLNRMGRVDEALKDFSYVADQPKNKFTEPALVMVARKSFADKQYAVALDQYKQLASIGEYKENLLESEIGQMRCNFELKKYQGAISNAQIALETSKTDQKLENEANLIIAKSNLNLEAPAEAMTYFDKVIEAGTKSQAAEALYLKSRILYNQDQLDSSETVIFQVVEKFRGEANWVAKSLILLSDIYVSRGDLFQAKATLHSVIDNYNGGGDVLTQAQSKLDTIVEIESQPEEVEPSELEIDFEETIEELEKSMPLDSITPETTPEDSLKNE
jgi:TolA-binding protein